MVGGAHPTTAASRGFAPTIGTRGKGFRLEFTLKLPSLLESGAVESRGYGGKPSNLSGYLW